MAGYIILSNRFHREGNRWVATCDELGTSTFGRSLPEAERKLKEAIVLHLNTLEDVGERQRFFQEHRITYYRSKPRKPVTICVPTSPETYVRPHIQAVGALTPA